MSDQIEKYEDDFLASLEKLPDVPELARELIIAEEIFQETVRANIEWLMKEKNVSKAKLAEMLEVSRARITKMFNDDSPNLTLKTIARVFHVLGEEAVLTSPTLDMLKSQAKVKSNYEHQKVSGWVIESLENKEKVVSVVPLLTTSTPTKAANRSRWTSNSPTSSPELRKAYAHG